MYVYIYRKKLGVRWRTLLKCTNQTDFSGLHVLTGTELSKFNNTLQNDPFSSIAPTHPLLKLNYNIVKYGGEGMLESLNKSKIGSSHTLSFLQTRKRERGGGDSKTK